MCSNNRRLTVSNGSVKVVFVTLQYTQQHFAVFSRRWPRVFDSDFFYQNSTEITLCSFALKPKQLLSWGVQSTGLGITYSFGYDLSGRISSDSIYSTEFRNNVLYADSCGLFVYLNIYYVQICNSHLINISSWMTVSCARNDSPYSLKRDTRCSTRTPQD